MSLVPLEDVALGTRYQRVVQIEVGRLAPFPAWKRAMDVFGALVLLLITAPAFAVIMVAIRLESRGGAFYIHERVGRGGRIFRCLKFRSMYAGADQERALLAAQNEGTGPIFKMRHDPRVTGVGRVLRRTSLDELPQLWNILRGDMSMVGPRPPLPDEVAEYTPRQLQRLAGTPGLTGLWQVTARARHDFDEMTELDLLYLEHISLASDISILLRTVRTVVKAEGSY
ncbi:MAG: sugar transferase [Dehalococcoidia bacterium]|nr:sugar transferase [Dehalococcoidia bacterium]